MATSGGVLALAVATLLLRAACRSSTWAYRDLSQSILFHPFSGWPFIHTQHKRLLPEPSRIPHHQYALSAPRPPESNDPSGRCGAAGSAAFLNIAGLGSHVLSWLRVACTRVNAQYTGYACQPGAEQAGTTLIEWPAFGLQWPLPARRTGVSASVRGQLALLRDIHDVVGRASQFDHFDALTHSPGVAGRQDAPNDR